MEKYIDYYKVLQVHQDADQKIIDAAYRCMSKQYHPDINKNLDAENRMKIINMAYGVLGDKGKRRVYHAEWLLRNQGRTASYVTGGAGSKIELAGAILDEFFRDMIKENWETAYKKLTQADCSRIPVQDFADWKTAVNKLYKLVNFEIKYEKRYSNCEYAGVVYPDIIQFYMDLTVMDITTGEMAEENTTKYVAYKDDCWKICLGYTDLQPIIQKFIDRDLEKRKAKYYFDMQVPVQRELARSHRYGNPLTLIFLVVVPERKESLFSSYEQGKKDGLSACINDVGNVLQKHLRTTDIIGRYGENAFALFLTETTPGDGQIALGKLLNLVEQETTACKLRHSLVDCTYGGNAEEILKAVYEETAPNDMEDDFPYFL